MENIDELPKPVFKRKPDFTNDVGTKGWQINDFDEQIKITGLDLKVVFTEFEEDWCYILVEEKDVIYETLYYSDINEIIVEIEKVAILKFQPE